MILGIDLGTSRTRACFLDDDGEPVFATSDRGEWAMPSVVAVEPDGEIVAGWDAVDPDPRLGRAILLGSKRRIGRAEDAAAGRTGVTAIEASAMLLTRIVLEAERRAGASVDGVVLAVPARYDFARRSAVLRAAALAEIPVLRLVHESTAAALGGRDVALRDEIVAVVDLGAGTFDISLLECGDGVVRVLAAGGSLRLGGNDFDDRVERHLYERIEAVHGARFEELTRARDGGCGRRRSGPGSSFPTSARPR